MNQILALLVELNSAVRELTVAVLHVEGLALAQAAYIAKRNGEDLDRLKTVIGQTERDIQIHIAQQAGGIRAENLGVESDRDASIAGGNIEGGGS